MKPARYGEGCRSRLCSWLAVCLLACYPVFALAGNVAPLGLEIGKADLHAVRAKLSGARLEDHGINKWSHGPMLRSDGRNLDIDGLEEIVFIFDPQNRLQGVIMTMGKDRFQEVRGFLAGKYRKVREVVPFVGDAYARYASGDSVVEIDAPHLSFSMEVRYLSNALLKAFQTQSSLEEAARKKAQSEKF